LWDEDDFDGKHVEWRRRLSRAEDAHHGTEFVVDILVDGGAPIVQADFDDKIPDIPQQVALRASFLP